MDTNNIVYIGTCQMDKKGRITIPKKIRDVFHDFGNIDSDFTLRISMTPDGKIILAPAQRIEQSHYMASDPETLKMAIKAYRDIIEGRFLSDDELNDLLKR